MCVLKNMQYGAILQLGIWTRGNGLLKNVKNARNVIGSGNYPLRKHLLHLHILYLSCIVNELGTLSELCIIIIS